MIIVGLTGYKGSGKTTVAETLVKDHGFTEISFAAPLKRMIRNLDPIVGHLVDPDDCWCDECHNEESIVRLSKLYDWDFDDEDIKTTQFGEELRRLWERFGTEVMRAEDPNYWIRALAREVERLTLEGVDKIVISDVRFPNEAEFVYAYGNLGYVSSVWEIRRTDAIPEEGLPKHAAESHVGRLGEEIGIVNDASFEELADAVGEALDIITGTHRPAAKDFAWFQPPLFIFDVEEAGK